MNDGSLDAQRLAHDTRDRFIPVPRSAIVAELAARTELPFAERSAFAEFARLLTALIHDRFHARQESLKAAYLPIAPKSDLIIERAHAREKRAALEREVLERIERLLVEANYIELGRNALEAIFVAPPPFPIQVLVDFDDYDVLRCYYRGFKIVEEVSRSRKPPFKREVRHVPTYARVLLAIRERDDERLLLKLFCDVPQSALEMLLPRRRLSMGRSDRWQLAAIGGSAVAGGAGLIHSAMFAANSGWLLMGMGGVWATKVALGVRRTRERYVANLLSRLYYANLANNVGVIQELVDLAEEEECKETLLAFYFLRRAGGVLPMAELDAQIEAFLSERFGAVCDFEIEDGVRKLVEEGIAELDADGQTVRAVDAARACELLDAHWDSLFWKKRSPEPGSVQK